MTDEPQEIVLNGDATWDADAEAWRYPRLYFWPDGSVTWKSHRP